jgi:hypothetical protein
VQTAGGRGGCAGAVKCVVHGDLRVAVDVLYMKR